jgi:hypothetical protein
VYDPNIIELKDYHHMPNKLLTNNNTNAETAGYYTWTGNKNGDIGYTSHGSIDNRIVQRATADHTRFQRYEGNVSVRDQVSRTDYEYFRPNESLPKKPKDKIAAGMDAYENVGLVHNIIDLMGDFVSQGIRLNHPDPRKQKIAHYWFNKICGPERSERFANYLYRCGMVTIKRQTAKLKAREVENLERGFAAPDIDVDPPIIPLKREIPWKYTFLNPLTLEVIDEELSVFVGDFQYGVRLPTSLINTIKNPKTARQKQLIQQLPAEVISTVNAGQKIIPLDVEKVSTFFYKRDDWKAWSAPMATCIFKDLLMLEKTKLADLAALDGAISQIRLWRLGSLEHKIMPNDALVNKLADALLHNVGGGAIDLIWDAALDFKESNSTVYNFLGMDKYTPILTAIHQGLGIPSSLSGGTDTFTNNYIALKTLIERLNYGRNLLIAFWNQEIKLFQKALGWQVAPTIQFDFMVLDDEAAVKQLWLNLWDRDLVSTEGVREKISVDNDIENARIAREYKMRAAKKVPDKASPYHDAQPDYGLEKIFAQAGSITPDEVGLELKPRKPGSKSPLELKLQSTEKVAKSRIGRPPGQDISGPPGSGRPRLSRDTVPRKTRRVLPSTKALVNLVLWAQDTQSAIAEVINKVFLQKCGKQNMRQLTTAETNEVSDLKFAAIYGFKPFEEINPKIIAQRLMQPFSDVRAAEQLYNKCLAKFTETRGIPTFEHCRQIQSYVYAILQGDYNNGENID